MPTTERTIRVVHAPAFTKFVLGTIMLIAGCADSTTEPNAEWDGVDDFVNNSLSNYNARTERDGPADFWHIENGWLVAGAEGDVFRGNLLREGVEMVDGRIEIDSNHVAWGGLVFRYQNPDDYYLLSVRDDDNTYSNARQRNFELYHDEATLARIDLDLPRGELFTVTVEFVGDVISLYLNGDPVYEIHDRSLLSSGAIGLSHTDILSPTEESRFDVFRWKSLD